MRVLVGCELSGRVRAAFRKLGHAAWSCDLLPADDGSHYHIQDDVMTAIAYGGWDVGIFFPPCTHLAVSGARWWKDKPAKDLRDAERFFMRLVKAKIPRKAIENPIGRMSTVYRKPDQIIQPWMFGHGETKATCLWLENLPKLEPTRIVSGRIARVHLMAPGPNRAKDRSQTYQGIADAMAAQWGSVASEEGCEHGVRWCSTCADCRSAA